MYFFTLWTQTVVSDLPEGLTACAAGEERHNIIEEDEQNSLS